MPHASTASPATPPHASDLNDLLRQRYGPRAPDLSEKALTQSDTLALLLQHRSVRRFTSDIVSAETITALVAAAQSASTSSNHQVWSVVEVRDATARRRLVEESHASTFVADAPVVLLFVADWARATEIASWQGDGSEATEYMESTLVGFIDAAIAAQTAVIAAESLGLGTCFLGSLRNDPEATAQIVDLPQGAVVAFGVALGWPHPEYTTGIKPRLGQAGVHSQETYRPIQAEDVDAYERALEEYNTSQGRTSPGWVRALVARTKDITGMKGRHPMREWLAARGFPSR